MFPFHKDLFPLMALKMNTIFSLSKVSKHLWFVKFYSNLNYYYLDKKKIFTFNTYFFQPVPFMVFHSKWHLLSYHPMIEVWTFGHEISGHM